MTFRSVTLAGAVFAALGAASPAFAQIDPDDTGLGTKLGMQQQNNSGEVGTVTLYQRPGATLVVISVASEPPGRVQPAHVHRGHSCAEIDPKPAYVLAPVINGLSRTLVQAAESKLLSGNYVVNVHASNNALGHYVSCGELYR